VQAKTTQKYTVVYPAGCYETSPGTAEFKKIDMLVINYDSK